MNSDKIAVISKLKGVLPALVDELSRCSKLSVDTEGCWRCGRMPDIAPDAWLHTLYYPKTGAISQIIEDKLGINLPLSHKVFIDSWNGATLFHGDLEIWGVFVEDISKRHLPSYDIIEENLRLREARMLSHARLAVANMSTGEIITLHTSSGIVEEFDMNSQEYSRYHWQDFSNWLDEQAIELVEDWG